MHLRHVPSIDKDGSRRLTSSLVLDTGEVSPFPAITILFGNRPLIRDKTFADLCRPRGITTTLKGRDGDRGVEDFGAVAVVLNQAVDAIIKEWVLRYLPRSRGIHHPPRGDHHP